MKKLYTVRAKVTTYCTLEVEAENGEEALEIANNTDGGDFITDNLSGDFQILEVQLANGEQEEVKPDEEGQKYPRKCDITGEGMHEGWYAEGTGEDFKYEKDALAHAKKLGYKTLQDAYDDDEIYWTEYYQDEDEYVVLNGELVEINK